MRLMKCSKCGYQFVQFVDGRGDVCEVCAEQTGCAMMVMAGREIFVQCGVPDDKGKVRLCSVHKQIRQQKEKD